MDTHNIEDIIPEQQTGAKTDTEHSVAKKDRESAIRLFNLAKERLQDINKWHSFAGRLSADFKLADSNGQEVSRKAQKGDHFKINVPAPGNKTGEGYDWVSIEAIDDKSDPSAEVESFAIRVRPAENPVTDNHDVAHFFKDTATSSFAVRREGNTVIASVHGRNEVPNTEAESLLDKARNAVVALGAMAGLSNPQWKSLVKGLLEEGEEK